ncbi:MAG: pirin family protein [Bacteroidales bacterium]|nr:pirin family protein [Bacteroidales bacterium]
MSRTIKNIHKAINAPIDDLITFRAMPTASIEHIDPFLFLNHHGPQTYLPNNNGLPFGPHPHRGFETLTFIYEGDLTHWDTGGGKNVILKDGIQWLTAGKGLIHAEISSDEFKKTGGQVEIIQLWMNLSARLKMTEPKYIGLQKDQIPEIFLDDNKVLIRIISGQFESVSGPVTSPTGIQIADIRIKKGGEYRTTIEKLHNILLYVVKGKIQVNGNEASKLNLVEFNTDGSDITITALEDSVIIFGHAKPFNEPVVAQGPFVMNSKAEINQAYLDYQNGKMGSFNDFN